MNLNYYYGLESEAFSFYRIPRLLVTDPKFRGLSCEAKLLYSLLLDRMGLSARNDWLDDEGRVYIYYTLEEIMEDMHCGHNKAVKLLAELDTEKGFGIIERVKQGQGKPARIYVIRLTTKDGCVGSTPSQSGSQDFPKQAVQTSDLGKSGLPKTGSADIPKAEASYIDNNYNYKSYTDSANPPPPKEVNEEREDTREEVRTSIDYDDLILRFPRSTIDNLVEIIADALCSSTPTVRINGSDIPLSSVKRRLWGLDSSHIEYVMDVLHDNTTEIQNVRAYLLTLLYNAPVTIDSYYDAKVRHDDTG